MQRLSLVSVILAITITLSIFREVSMRNVNRSLRSINHLCSPCYDDECNQKPPQYCPWGENKDPCGRRVCSKGPGERCGGEMRALGECGEGLMCRATDQRCHGCSLITLDCF